PPSPPGPPEALLRLLNGRVPLGSFFAFLLLVAPALAQTSATLRGRVTDAEGLALPGASITLRNQDTGEERTSVADRTGDYRIPALPPGLYRLEASMDGFQPQVRKDLRIEVAQVSVQDVKLSVGNRTEQVDVVAESQESSR